MLSTAASAQEITNINVSLFQSELALPIYVAEDRGFFAAQGLAVAVTPTQNSAQLMTGLIRGDYHFAQAAMDNFLAYQEQQVPVVLDPEPDLVVLLGTATVNLTLIGTPEIDAISDLRGRPIGVDAPTTGFAFALFDMLEKNGLGENDYTLVSVGGTSLRWDALQERQISGSLLNGTFTNDALAKGFRRLADSVDVIGPYQGSVIGANRAWVSAHRRETIAFLRAILQAIETIYDPSNHTESARSLAQRFEGMSLETALSSVNQLVAGPATLTVDGSLSPEGVDTVMRLRNRYGVPKRNITDIGKYVDLTYYDTARAPD
jgi:ABC-type nitrate/sulfonate/bicarbonate transport system substrate-binding protein